ncbi:MAG TPA: hypothetical protein VMV29_11805 [Ktedonobacterales bacterium]|nr:hypothetical protein [Ktedonobacterales bacterium]
MKTQQQQIADAAARILADAAQRQQNQPPQQRLARPTVASVAQACHELAPIARTLTPTEQVTLTAALISAQRRAQRG